MEIPMKGAIQKLRSYLQFIVASAFIINCLILSAGLAGADTNVNILPPSETAGYGDKLILQVYVEPDRPIAGLQLDLNYDPSLININKIEEGDLFSNSDSPVMFNPGNINESSGTVSQIYSTIIMDNSITKEGIFCIIHLETQSKEGICQLRINNLVLGDEQGEILPVRSLDSIISINDQIATIDEEEKIDNEDRSVPDIIQADGESGESQAETDKSTSNGGKEHEERIFASPPETPGEDEITDSTIQRPVKGNPDISTLILAAIFFIAVAYFLDRKE